MKLAFFFSLYSFVEFTSPLTLGRHRGNGVTCFVCFHSATRHKQRNANCIVPAVTICDQSLIITEKSCSKYRVAAVKNVQ